MVKSGDVPLRNIPPPASPPLPPPQPPVPPPLPPPVPATVFSQDQIATIKRNLNFLQRATKQPLSAPGSLPRPSPPHTPAAPPNHPHPPSPDCYSLEPSWTTFKNHFQVPYPPPGYSKNAPLPFSCLPPPLGQVEMKPENLPPPIRRPAAEPADSSAPFEFALEAEKMVSELCSSSKDFSEKVPTADANRFEVYDRRRHPEPWSINPRETRAHVIDDYHQTGRLTHNLHGNSPSKLETNVQLPCIYEDDLCLRDFIVKSCIEVGNALKGHERNSQFSDLVGFCRMVRDSAENPSTHEFHQDEVRSQILTFFRLASSWLSIYPLIERAGMQKDEYRIEMYRYFNDWQMSTCRMMELIVKNMPSIKERIDSYPNADALAYGDQAHRRQPFMHYDPQNSMDNLKRQRSVPNVQGHQRQWRQRRCSDHHFDENHNWHRNNTQNPRDVNNRNKWTIVSPDMYHHKPHNQSSFRKSDVYQDKPDNQNRYRPKECIPGRSSVPVFSDHDKAVKWKYHSMYPSGEPEQDSGYKIDEDSSQDELVQHNMAAMSQIEPRCIQKHSDQQPVDLDALFQGYRVANENPKNSSDRQMYKGAPNQGQMRYGCKVNPQNRGRRWYNNYNFCPPPWVTNAVYDQDDRHDGVYMKPGSYDVPKRDQKPGSRQLMASPQLPPPPAPVPPVMMSAGPRFKAQTEDVTWQAALASAETFCKSLRSTENYSTPSDAQQQWIQKGNRSESEEVVTQSYSADDSEGAVADASPNKSAVRKTKSSRSSSITAGDSPPPAPPSSPPLPSPPTATSPPSQPLSGHRSLSPSASQKLRRFLETVWAVNEASHMKFSPDQENGGLDTQKVLEDTFQRLLDEGWAAGGPAPAPAPAPSAGAAVVNRRQTKHQQ